MGAQEAGIDFPLFDEIDQSGQTIDRRDAPAQGDIGAPGLIQGKAERLFINADG